MVRIKRQKPHPHKRKRDFKFIFKYILAVMVVAGIGVSLAVLKYMFTDSDCFNIRAVDLRFYDENNSLKTIPLASISNNKIIGTNIFLVDLGRFREEIETEHPGFKDVVIRRLLPNRLIVQAKKRMPLAQIRSDRIYFVDEDGVFLPDIKNITEENAPLILGLRITTDKSSGPKLNLIQQQRLDKALDLIHSLSVNKRLSRYRLKTVDITDSRNLSFFLDMANVEIKIGDAEFDKRLAILATVLEQLGQDIKRVKYIDLRFEDPIVGPK